MRGVKNRRANILLLLNDVFWCKNLDNIISGPLITVQNEKQRQFMTPLSNHQRKMSHPFCLFSNQKRSAFLMRSNWSRMMVENTGPGPPCDSSRPPTNSSSLEVSFSYNSASSLNNWKSVKRVKKNETLQTRFLHYLNNNWMGNGHSGYLLLRDSC